MMLLLAFIQLLASPAGFDIGTDANTDVGTLADNMAKQRQTVIYAQVAPECAVDTSGSEKRVDVTTTADQTLGEVNYRCNSPNGFTRRISSENSGQLRRGTQGIPYFVSQSGDGALAMSRVQLTTPITDQVAASALLTVGSSGFLKIDVPNLPRGLIAGEYRDVVSIEITPN